MPFALGLVAAARTTHVETALAPQPMRDGAIEATFARQQMLTVRLTPP